MINNRQQSGRRRGRGGQRQNGTTGRYQDTGNRIDNRAKGNAAQLLEKYKTLARDAQQGGDRVMAEYYFQFADHYFRVLSETRARFEENNPNRRQQNDFNDPEQGFEGEMSDGDDDDFDTHQQAPQQQQREQPQQREAREPRDPRESRGDRQQRNDRPDGNARQDGRRDGRDRNRDERGDESGREGFDTPRFGGNDENGPNANANANAPSPRGEVAPRRGRPPARNANGGELQDREESTIDIGMLPPSIGTPTAPAASGSADAEDAPAPRRRGRPRKIVTEAPIEG